MSVLRKVKFSTINNANPAEREKIVKIERGKFGIVYVTVAGKEYSKWYPAPPDENKIRADFAAGLFTATIPV